MGYEDYSHIEIATPIGLDAFIEKARGRIEDLCFIGKCFGRVQRHKRDKGKSAVYYPAYFNRRGEDQNYRQVDLSISRELTDPSYGFFYPYGEEKIENGLNDFEASRRVSLICFFHAERLKLQLGYSYNHIPFEEVKKDLITAIKKMEGVSDMKYYNEAKEVLFDFSLIDESLYMYPYFCIRLDFTVNYPNCIKSNVLCT